MANAHVAGLNLHEIEHIGRARQDRAGQRETAQIREMLQQVVMPGPVHEQTPRAVLKARDVRDEQEAALESAKVEGGLGHVACLARGAIDLLRVVHWPAREAGGRSGA